MGNVITETIGDGIEVIIEGLPESIITPATQAQTALKILTAGIPQAANLTEGVLGGIRIGTLKIGSEYYKFKYSIRLLKPLTALEVYSLAIQHVENGLGNKFDPELGKHTLKWLRKSFEEEFPLDNSQGNFVDDLTQL